MSVSEVVGLENIIVHASNSALGADLQKAEDLSAQLGIDVKQCLDSAIAIAGVE